MKQYLEIGKVNNTHGLKGEIKMAMWCDDIDYIKQLKTVYLDDEGKKALTLLSARQQKNVAILKLAEVTDIDAAEQLKGKVLYRNMVHELLIQFHRYSMLLHRKYLVSNLKKRSLLKTCFQ